MTEQSVNQVWGSSKVEVLCCATACVTQPMKNWSCKMPLCCLWKLLLRSLLIMLPGQLYRKVHMINSSLITASEECLLPYMTCEVPLNESSALYSKRVLLSGFSDVISSLLFDFGFVFSINGFWSFVLAAISNPLLEVGEKHK